MYLYVLLFLSRTHLLTIRNNKNAWK